MNNLEVNKSDLIYLYITKSAKTKCITKNLLFLILSDENTLQIYLPYQSIVNKIFLNIEFKVL